MPRLSGPVSGLASLTLAIVLSLTALTPAVAAQSTSQVEIAIVVLPPVEETEPLADMASTMSAVLLFGEAPQSQGSGASAASLDLQVVDAHGSEDGWLIKLMQPDADGAVESQDSDAFLLQTDRAPLQRSGTTRSDWLSMGQPLDRMTPVLRAEPGVLPGVHQMRFDLAGHPASVAPLVVSLSAAP